MPSIPDPQRRAGLAAALAGWATVLIGLAAAQGVSALALIIVARRVAPAEYGQYLASYALASLLAVLPAWGLDGWLLAQGATAPEQVGGLWSAAWRLRLRFLLGWLAGMGALALVLPPAAYPPALVLAAAVSLAADSLALLSFTAWRNLGRHRRVMAFQTAGALALLVAALALPLRPGAIVLLAGGRLAISLAVALAVSRAAAGDLHRAPALPAPRLLRAARPFLLAEIAVAVYLRADLTIVSFAMGAAGASVYGPALNLVNMSFLAPNALYFLALPALARAFGRSPDAFRRLGAAQLAAQAATGLLLAVAIFALAGPIIGLAFGPGYAASAGALRLLSPILAFKSLNFGLGALLTAAGLQSRRTRIQVGVAFFNVVANLMIVGRWGIGGVAVVYTASEILLCAGYALTAGRWWRWVERNSVA